MAPEKHDMVSGRVWPLQAECDSVGEHYREASGVCVCVAETGREW